MLVRRYRRMGEGSRECRFNLNRIEIFKISHGLANFFREQRYSRISTMKPLLELRYSRNNRGNRNADYFLRTVEKGGLWSGGFRRQNL